MELAVESQFRKILLEIDCLILASEFSKASNPYSYFGILVDHIQSKASPLSSFKTQYVTPAANQDAQKAKNINSDFIRMEEFPSDIVYYVLNYAISLSV